MTPADPDETTALAIIDQTMIKNLGLIANNARPYNGAAIELRRGEPIRQAIQQNLREMGILGFKSYQNFLNHQMWNSGTHSIILQQTHPNVALASITDEASYLRSLTPTIPPQILKLTGAKSVPLWPTEMNDCYNFPPDTDTQNRRLIQHGNHAIIISREPLAITIQELKLRHQHTPEMAEATRQLYARISAAGGTLTDTADENIGFVCDENGQPLRDLQGQLMARMIDVGAVKWPERAASQSSTPLQPDLGQAPATHQGHALDRSELGPETGSTSGRTGK